MAPAGPVKIKVRSHGVAVAANFLLQQAESVQAVRLQLSYTFK